MQTEMPHIIDTGRTRITVPAQELHMVMGSVRPVLRIFDNHLAKAFYIVWMADKVD